MCTRIGIPQFWFINVYQCFWNSYGDTVPFLLTNIADDQAHSKSTTPTPSDQLEQSMYNQLTIRLVLPVVALPVCSLDIKLWELSKFKLKLQVCLVPAIYASRYLFEQFTISQKTRIRGMAILLVGLNHIFQALRWVKFWQPIYIFKLW
jgi:hypothetical protein